MQKINHFIARKSIFYCLLLPCIANALLVRDPFLPSQFSHVNKGADKTKSILQRYPLNQIIMVGVIKTDEVLWGVVRTPNGFYRVEEGESLGNQGEQIIAIEPDKIQLTDKNTGTPKIIELKLRKKYVW